MKIEYREVEYTDVLELIALARTEAYPDVAISVEEIREQSALRPKDLYRHVELIYADGEFAGFWSLLREAMFANEGEMHFRLAVLPAFEGLGIERESTEKAIALAKQLNLAKVVSVARSSHAACVDSLTELGFELKNKDVISRLELAEFDAQKWQPILDSVEKSGIRIVSAEDLEKSDPAWTEKAYQMHIELMGDVPFAANYTPPPYERWCNKLRNPKLFDLDLMYFAVDGTQFVGETAIFRITSEMRNYLTGLTGVVATHRRRNIALALKVVALKKALADGAKTVSTGNEENNPIRLLNEKLGYRTCYEELGFILNLHC